MAKWHQLREVGPEYLKTAKVRIDTRVEVRATPEEVFRLLQDGEAWSGWVPFIRSVRWTSEPPFGVGSRRVAKLKSGQLYDDVFLIWEAPRRMTFRVDRLSGARNFDALVEDYVIEPTAEGCALTWIFAADPRGGLGLVMRIVRPWLARSYRRMMRSLAREAERRAAQR